MDRADRGGQHSSASATPPVERSETMDYMDLDGIHVEDPEEAKTDAVDLFFDKGNQLYQFMVRWSFPKDWDLPRFFAAHETLSARFRDLIGEKGAFVFQRELTGDANHHYQGYLKLTAKRRLLTLAALLREDFPGIHLQPASTAGREALRTYCMKTDTRQAGPWADRPLIRPYRGEDLPKELYPWQQHIVDSCKQPADDRTINVVLDEGGNKGKSKLVKYMVYHKLAEDFTFDTATNLRYQIVEAGARTAYLIDLPRNKPKLISMSDLYNTLEDVKNGKVRSGKYQTGKLLMDPPHVWVFTNVPLDKNSMSQDRWVIWTISDNRELVRL